MCEIVNFVIINGDEYIDNIEKHIDNIHLGIGLPYFKEYEIVNRCYMPREELMCFFINESQGGICNVEVETEFNLSVFEVPNERVEAFIFGLLAFMCPIVEYDNFENVGLDSLADTILNNRTSEKGFFCLTNTNDNISILGRKIVYAVVEGNGDNINYVNRYIDQLRDTLGDGSLIVSVYVLNEEMGIGSEEIVYLYTKDY